MCHVRQTQPPSQLFERKCFPHNISPTWHYVIVSMLFSSKLISSCTLYRLETNVCCLFFWLNAVCKVLFVLIFTDSLGECVSTLSKRFSASESFSDALSGISHSHKDRHSELRHRKQPYIQQETLKTKVIQWSMTSVHEKNWLFKIIHSIVWYDQILLYSSSSLWYQNCFNIYHFKPNEKPTHHRGVLHFYNRFITLLTHIGYREQIPNFQEQWTW